MIYFIEDIGSGQVKIGFSEKPWGRFVKVQADCPGKLRMVAICDGDRQVEAAIQARFAGLRARGEWFNSSPELSEFMASLGEPVKPPGLRRTDMRSPTRFAEATGLSKTYACQILKGARVPNLSLALKIYNDTGLALGPIADAPPEDLAVLARWAPKLAA